MLNFLLVVSVLLNLVFVFKFFISRPAIVQCGIMSRAGRLRLDKLRASGYEVVSCVEGVYTLRLA